ncbi:MAG: c-type cytochrome, partial [Terriglobales bacterium]
MRRFLLVVVLVALVLAAGFLLLRHQSLRATHAPGPVETALARRLRNWAIPRHARNTPNPVPATPFELAAGRDLYLARCQTCHGLDGSGRTAQGGGLSPRAADLRSTATQQLSDGELHYIIQYGVRFTGMPAWAGPPRQNDDPWKLVLYLRQLQQQAPSPVAPVSAALARAHYVGSAACAGCHADIYTRWARTPMANVVRDPRNFPHAILADLAHNPIAPASPEQVALVYGSIWKQRYFTKIGNDYFPLPVQWEVAAQRWSKYVVPPHGGDWWAPHYPGGNMQRPTGPLCDGCHSVGYDISTHQVAEWNVGCERCHGPGSEHVAHPTPDNILNPAHLDPVAASDTCIQCHSQGQPLANPIEGRYYDWPVGYNVDLQLKDYWKLEEHTLGAPADFFYYPDGTAHKNRMQGNDFIQSVMYRRGITCFDCHDVHGTAQSGQLRKPAQQLCLECHFPGSPNGPRTATLEAHTHHAADSPGSQCVACHMPAIETEGVPG